MAVSAEDARRLMEDIADHPERHKLAISNIVKKYRRLGKWLKINADPLGTRVGVSVVYTMGVVGRVLELTGHRLGDVTPNELEATAAQIMEAVPALLPLDEGLPQRLAALQWIAEPAMLDVLVEDVFRTQEDDEGARPPEVMFQVFVLVWIAVEVLAMAAARRVTEVRR